MQPEKCETQRAKDNSKAHMSTLGFGCDPCLFKKKKEKKKHEKRKYRKYHASAQCKLISERTWQAKDKIFISSSSLTSSNSLS